MKKTILALPLVVLLLVASATAEDSPEEKALLHEMQQVEQKLMAVDKELRAATDPEKQKRLVANLQALHQHLAQLNEKRESLRLASAKRAARQEALEEKITLSLDDLPVSEALKLLTASTGISIDVPPEVAKRPVTLTMKERTRLLALMDLAGRVDCDLSERPDGSFSFRPRRTAERRETARRGAAIKEGHIKEIEDLRDRHLEEKVNLSVRDVALADVVRTLTHNHRVHVRLPPSARDAKVTLSVTQVPRREALARAGAQAGLRLVPGDGEVVHFVPDAVRLDAASDHRAKAQKELAEKLDGKVVLPPKWGFAWNPVHLDDLRRRLETEKNPGRRADIEDEIRIREAIEKVESSGIPRRDYSQVRVTMRFDDLPLSEAATQLARAHEVEILVPRRFGERRISVDLKDQTLPAAVGWLARAAGGIASTSGKGLWVIWPVATLRTHEPIEKAMRAPPRFKTARAPGIRLQDPSRPLTPQQELRALRDEIRALRAEIAEIKAILLRGR